MNKISYLRPTTTFTPDQALDSAKNLNQTDVIIIGYDEDGDFFVRSSRMDRKDALWLTERMRFHIFNG